jgi:hypothetical protein
LVADFARAPLDDLREATARLARPVALDRQILYSDAVRRRLIVATAPVANKSRGAGSGVGELWRSNVAMKAASSLSAL